MDDLGVDFDAFLGQLEAKDESETRGLVAIERKLRTCTCPLSHQIAGVCPKLEFLARFRDPELEDVLTVLRATPIETIPECTKTKADAPGPPFVCTCMPMHYAVLATCPKRKPERLLPNNGNKGSRCRTDNYGGTGALLGHVGNVLSDATISAHRLAQQVTAAELVVAILSRERESEAKEAADMLTNRTMVDWNPSKEAVPQPAPSLLPVNLPVKFKNSAKEWVKGHVITNVTATSYAIARVSDRTELVLEHKRVEPDDAFPGVSLLVKLPHGCTATNEGNRTEANDERWSALVSHEWGRATVSFPRSSVKALKPGDQYTIPPFTIGEYAAAPAVCGVVRQVLPDNTYLLLFAWVIAAKDVLVHDGRKVYAKGKQFGEGDNAPYRIEIPDKGETRTFKFTSVPIGTGDDGAREVEELLDLKALDGARPVTKTAAPTVATSSTLLYTASTRVTVDIMLAMLTCVEPDEVLRAGRIRRLFYLASSARVLRREKPGQETPAKRKDALRLRAILIGIELCAQTRGLVDSLIDSTSQLGAPDKATGQIAIIEAGLRRARRQHAEAWETPAEVLAVVTELESANFFTHARHDSMRALIASAEYETRGIRAQYNEVRFGAFAGAFEEDMAKAAAEEAEQAEQAEQAARLARPMFEVHRVDGPEETKEITPAELEAIRGYVGTLLDNLDETLASGVVEGGEVRAMAPIAAEMVVAYVPLIALRRSFFDNARARPEPRDPNLRHAVKVSGVHYNGVTNYDFKGTVFVPMFDSKGHEWLEANDGANRFAIVGSKIIHVSGGTCTTLVKKDKNHKWPTDIVLEDQAPSTQREGNPFPTGCKVAKSLASARRERRKIVQNTAKTDEERRDSDKAERARTVYDTLRLRGAVGPIAPDESQPFRVERARAATKVCRENMRLARGRQHTNQAREALECDMRLYDSRARIAELLLEAIDKPSAGTWAGVATFADGLGAEAPAFGGRGFLREAARIVCAVKGLAEDESGHAQHVRALHKSDAGRRVSAALLAALPFGRALVAALGAACGGAQPSFGRSYV